ncbi:hypothetical protein [Xanthomonas euroxanthea]|uniref:hypothetical protein n=1 Tax=Xanthomonas euroxanthea TaxID=2259622 RepID=UPI0011C04343|nr:hypothetical protein [Xanthomonas euroxanthea]
MADSDADANADNTTASIAVAVRCGQRACGGGCLSSSAPSARTPAAHRRGMSGPTPWAHIHVLSRPAGHASSLWQRFACSRRIAHYRAVSLLQPHNNALVKIPPVRWRKASAGARYAAITQQL